MRRADRTVGRECPRPPATAGSRDGGFAPLVPAQQGNGAKPPKQHGGIRALQVALAALIVCGCQTPQQKAARQQQRSAAAKQLFDQTTKQSHLPSAEAKSASREKLLAQAATGYEQLLRQYRDQPFWCAQALRSLANVRAEQGRLDAAVNLYTQVGARYPHDGWEVLQAWKSAGDQLWDAGRQAEAKKFYQQIVTRFDQPDAPAVMKTIVKGSKSRLP